MDIKRIKEMLKIMEENDLQEIEIEGEGEKIRLKKTSPEAQPSITSAGMIENSGVSSQAQEEKKKTSAEFTEITAPMVGTFYRTPSPGAPPFTDIGNKIRKGEVVCIIEAMKLMNEITSEITGEITNILVENGDPVEYGQPLFLIRPE